jgi:hypothetical protein
MLREKLADTLPRLIARPGLFRHTVDETLLMEQKLRTVHALPESMPGLMTVLTSLYLEVAPSPDSAPQNAESATAALASGAGAPTRIELVESWLKVEKDWINDRLEGIRRLKLPYADIASKAAARLSLIDDDEKDDRTPRHGDTHAANEDDEDDNERLIAKDGEDAAADDEEDEVSSLAVRPTRSSHALISLVDAVTDRYRLLPEIDVRWRFANEVQLQLLAIYLEDCDAEYKRIAPQLMRLLDQTRLPSQTAPRTSGERSGCCGWLGTLLRHHELSSLRGRGAARVGGQRAVCGNALLRKSETQIQWRKKYHSQSDHAAHC